MSVLVVGSPKAATGIVVPRQENDTLSRSGVVATFNVKLDAFGATQPATGAGAQPWMVVVVVLVVVVVVVVVLVVTGGVARRKTARAFAVRAVVYTFAPSGLSTTVFAPTSPWTPSMPSRSSSTSVTVPVTGSRSNTASDASAKPVMYSWAPSGLT